MRASAGRDTSNASVSSVRHACKKSGFLTVGAQVWDNRFPMRVPLLDQVLLLT